MKNRGCYFEFRKFSENQLNLIVKTLLGEFDFSKIELTNSTDFVLFMHNGWCFTLSFREDDVDKILRVHRWVRVRMRARETHLRCWDGHDLLEVILRCCHF